jgi:hypothetical protein
VWIWYSEGEKDSSPNSILNIVKFYLFLIRWNISFLQSAEQEGKKER